MIDNAPEVLNTLKELASAIGDDADFATNVNNRLTDIENVAYQVPVGGIPESDLSQEVKDKMNEKEVFWATYGTTTAAEIDAAVAAGKVVMCYFQEHIYKLEDCRSGQPLYFSCFIASQARYFLTVNRTTSVWANNLVNHELASYKVSSWSATPNNTRYPSEKLVKESLDVKAGISDVLFANFSNLTPKKTFEYDVSDTAYHPLFSRANTGISQLMSEVDDIVKFRITVTGTNIYARVDVVVRFQPALTAPCIMAWNEVLNASSVYTGINYLRTVFPKALSNGYDWVLEFNCFNTTARHIKVEVYEDTENITWIETNTPTSYNSTYQSVSTLVRLYTSRGLCANQTWSLPDTAAYSASIASYITAFLSTWIGGTLPLAGEALAPNQLVIISGQKGYKATNDNVPIDCDCGVFLVTGTFAANSALIYNAVKQKTNWATLTGDPALTFDTFARGDQVYLRCTLGQDGKIYPDGHLSNVKSAGYTWVHIGTAASATAINLDTCGKPFITLNNDGKVTHINGTAVMDSSMSKWGVVSQTQTWTQASDGGYDYTMSNLQYGWIPKAAHDAYLVAGVEFNDTDAIINKTTPWGTTVPHLPGCYYVNGIGDISYMEMIEIYAAHSGALANHFEKLYGSSTSFGRTNLGAPFRKTAYANVDNMFRANSKIETIYSSGALIGNMSFCFTDCLRLTTIGMVINGQYTSNLTGSFSKLPALRYIRIKNLKASISFVNSPALSVASILYMIQSEASTSAITITLHATAYARAIADSDVQAALQAHTNVSLASAT